MKRIFYNFFHNEQQSIDTGRSASSQCISYLEFFSLFGQFQSRLKTILFRLAYRA